MKAMYAGGIVLLAMSAPAVALDTELHGRIATGSAYRLEESAPHLLVNYNAAALGLEGRAASGQNTDDGNNNYRRGDTLTRSVHAFLELTASEGAFFAMLRLKAWYDDALKRDARPWGNSINAYTAGRPLGDAGATRMARFSGVALSDYHIAHSALLGGGRITTRIGQQSLPWGERSGFAGGIAALNAVDSPALRRAGATPQEFRAPAPMLYLRLLQPGGLGVEAFYQTRFQPSVSDLCGTFWATTDYLADGCNRTFTGAPAASDPVRLRNGAFLKRVAGPEAADGQFGAALTWSPAGADTDLGLYIARYTSRTPVAGLRKAARPGPGVIAGDPDGKNLAFFTEYVGGIDVMALTVSHRRGRSKLVGELTLRPRQPVQLPAADVLPAFLNPAAPSLVRADADAVAPGMLFHAYDNYRTMQLQAGVQHDWPRIGAAAVSTAADLVLKQARGMPDPARRRYGRADQYGSGPVLGVCNVNSPDPAAQCSFDGYVTPRAVAYRLRVDGRFALPVDGLLAHAWAMLTHDVKGWSYDFQINEGRRTANLALRLEYRQRHFAEIVYAPVWGGRYNAQADRDQVSLAVGTRF